MKALLLMALIAGTTAGGESSSPAQPSHSFIAFLSASLQKEPASLVRRLDVVTAALDRYRYTGEPALLSQANLWIEEGQKLDPAGYTMKKMAAWSAVLEESDPTRALELSRAYNRKTPDDIEVYGYLVDVYSAVGNYREAEEQANWMLRLRPQNRQAMRRAAELRETFADREGAISMLNGIYRAAPESETLERAWALSRIARYNLATAPKRAEQLAAQALKMAPESLEAASTLAALYRAANRPEEAAAILQSLWNRTRRLDVLYELASIKKDWAEFDQLSREAKRPAEVRCRIEYLLNHAGKPGEARSLAAIHIAVYRDAASLALAKRAGVTQ